MPSAAILVVGDEILEGHTQDTNSHYLAQRLHARGIVVRRIVACSDDVDDIHRQLESLLADRFEFVFVTGGIGPTPDDRTYEAVAMAAAAPLTVSREDESWLRERCRARGYATELLLDDASAEPLWRMVRRPEGSQRIENPIGMALGSAVRVVDGTVLVLPGVPREMRAMMEQVVEPSILVGLVRETRTAEIEYVGQEARLYGLMRDVEARCPGIKVGSYPQDDKGRVILRLQGPPSVVEAAQSMVLAGLPNAKRLR